MSIKIYHGFRLEQSHLNDFLPFARQRMMAEVFNIIRKVEKMLDAKLLGYPCTKVSESLKRSAESNMTSPFDVECGINLWLVEGFFLGFPVAGNNHLLRSFSHDKPDWLEEYGYWNNVDHSETEEEWEERRRMWDLACLKDHNTTRLFHEVATTKGMGMFHLKSAFEKSTSES